MSYARKDTAIIEAVSAAALSGANVVRSMREAIGYGVEELALTCGLATSEIVDMESGADADTTKLRRIATALGLPEDALVRDA